MRTGPRLQTLMNYLWLGKTLKESIASPVVYVTGKNELKFEKKFDQVMKPIIIHTVEGVPAEYIRLYTCNASISPGHADMSAVNA